MGTEKPARKLLTLLALALVALLTVAAAPVLADEGNNHGGQNGDNNGDHGNGDDAFQCNGAFTGVTINSDVVVPPNGSCTLTNSTVKGGVEALENAYFQATSTTIREDVEGSKALTVFIDTGSKVGGDVATNKTAQVFVFNATIDGGIAISGTTDKVNICGNTVNDEGIAVVKSGRDILVGDPLTVGCGSNTVSKGSVVIAKNNTDVELVVRGNSIAKGNMLVLDNAGTSDKFVQNNTGGKTLRCTGNSSPFTGSPNPGWQQYQGQCGP